MVGYSIPLDSTGLGASHIIGICNTYKTMITFEKECYEAIVTVDERSSVHFGYFINMIDALRASKGKGWWGSDGMVSKKTVRVVIYENMNEYDAQLLTNMKTAALAKLTKDEKELLGL